MYISAAYRNVLAFMRVHSVRGGVNFFLHQLKNNDEAVYVFDLKNVSMLDHVKLNSDVQTLLYEKPDFNEAFYDGFVSIKGEQKARLDLCRIRKNNDWLGAAYLDSKVAGWGIITAGLVNHKGLILNQGDCIIHSCVTLPAFRRRGVYTALLVGILKTMAMKGLRLAYITSKPFNKASIATIEKVGFQYHSLQKKKKVFQVLFDAVRF